MLTLPPPVWGVKDKPSGANGSNGVLWAWYWTGHPYAAAIAAQEVREVRMKLPYSLGGFLVPGLVGLFLPWQAVPLGMMVGLGLAAIFCRRASFRRKLEIRGQSVECVVRRDRYATPLDVALDEAAKQLSSYDQFDGWGAARIRFDLLAAIPSADKWAKANRALIERAM